MGRLSLGKDPSVEEDVIQTRLSPLILLREALGGGLHRYQKVGLYLPSRALLQKNRVLSGASSVELGSTVRKKDSLEFAGVVWS